MTEPRNPSVPDDSAFGVLRFKAGPGGGAVRLATLARDLMERHQMARAEAVKEHLLKPLIPPVDLPLSEFNPPTLYLLQPGGNAEPLGDREWFGTGSGNPEQGRRFRSGGIAGGGVTFAPVGRSVGRGLVGAVAWLKSTWGNPDNTDACMDYIAHGAAASRLAVSELDAVEVWGWGDSACVTPLVSVPVLTDWQRLIAERNGADRFLWTPEHALVIKTEEERRKAVSGAKGVRKAMAADMSEGGKSITHQKLFEAMHLHLANRDFGRRQG